MSSPETRALLSEEAPIFVQSSAGRSGATLPAMDVPATMLRPRPPGTSR